MDKDETEQWIDAIKAELKLFEDMDVFDEVTQEEAKVMKKEGSHPQRLPARLILVKKPSAQDHNGWKPKARVVCC
eukprot:5218954-Prorocentrum_lima.AAC.1